MTGVFFILSGEHLTLPKAETEAILAAEEAPYRILGEGTQLLRLDITPAAAEKVIERSAYTHLCCREIFQYPAKNLTEILTTAQKLNFEGFLRPKESFMVRVKRIRNSSTHINTATLERKLGAIIYKQIVGSWVNFEKPRRTFLGFLLDDQLIFGLKLREAEVKKFYFRTPRKKPFFHPSSLQPKLARCMVNLSKAHKSQVIYDPFCGTGTVMIEAGLMGFETLGSDLLKKMIKGAKLNLNYFKVKGHHLMVADALKTPIHHIDAIVTDPPYGRSATTRGLTTAAIIERLLSKTADLLSDDSAICVAAPKTADIKTIGEKHGFTVREIHPIRIHRSLTREIAVLTKR